MSGGREHGLANGVVARQAQDLSAVFVEIRGRRSSEELNVLVLHVGGARGKSADAHGFDGTACGRTRMASFL